LGLLAACGPPEYPGIDRSEEDAFRATWEFARLDARFVEENVSLDANIYEWTLTHDDELVDISEAKWHLEYTEGGGDWACSFWGGDPKKPLYTDGDLRTTEGRAHIGGAPHLVVDFAGTTLAEYCDLHLCVEPRMKLENRETGPSYLELDSICAPLY
jgi:hypothetical protein